MPSAGLAYEHELLAETLAIDRQRGARGRLWIAGHMGALASVGDAAGVHRFQLIAA